ncbi:hypothetical protein [Stenomitos frigidus]|uniref:Toprim domain-containing protein n=1 Tax=Stenomitos frigidus ULC18 TaxID=2107698 RepID=A0A2T1EI19_9CYAN|nr:hypothetical protein [Stenomitos frigidus]PSB32328.1 hypothetical protein C7B82_05840 [Stenomitos frigidus ULC18]
MTQPTSAHEPFDIRAWVDHNRSGRAACPACVQAGKANQRNLSIDLTTGAYHCWRGCTTAQIREALGAPKGSAANVSQVRSQHVQAVPPTQPRTISQERVRQSQKRLLHSAGQPQTKALAWLQARGFTHEMIAHYRLGLEPYWLTPEGNKAASKECYWAIALHLPAEASGHFYRKLRLAPWLTGEERPAGLPKWSQYGVPATLFYTYHPDQAEATWFCEGEWDAMRLGWLARQLQTSVAVCCATAGCGTVPKQADLAQLPGTVTLFFDRNDTPTQTGTIPGEAGARKLALALGDRGKIALVPMPDGCTVRG